MKDKKKRGKRKTPGSTWKWGVYDEERQAWKATFSQIPTAVFQRMSSVLSDRISLRISLISIIRATCDTYKPYYKLILIDIN
jgi:hypothetical protein